ncbi:hypothetical protein [Novipirellula sp.]|uniref:hypothetical protein n=1 Tax=Novipirellula sp. TaxID=2795430 RepID=UPI003566AB55
MFEPLSLRPDNSHNGLQSRNDNPLRERALFSIVASDYKNSAASIIRKGDWRLIQYLKKGKTELYNLRLDQKESQNLAAKNPEVPEALVKQLVAWRKANHVPLPPSSTLEF